MERKKILIVDDERQIIQSIAGKLRDQLNMQVINAMNGEMACQVAAKELPDLILMDWDMPVMNGIEATRYLKQQKQTHDIPIVISTGQMTSSEDLQVALESGATDFIRKPIDFIELIARINTAIRIREQYRAIQNLMKNEIELKNRKLSTTSMLIVEKNSLLQNVYTDLEGLEKNVKAVVQDDHVNKEFRSLKRRVQSHINIDNSWENFKLHFDEVHPDFFSRLSAEFPSLTHRDFRLCAYVRIGMDNKQIAHILNISHASVRTALFRMKKKLDLEEEDSLRTMIVQF